MKPRLMPPNSGQPILDPSCLTEYFLSGVYRTRPIIVPEDRKSQTSTPLIGLPTFQDRKVRRVDRFISLGRSLYDVGFGIK